MSEVVKKFRTGFGGNGCKQSPQCKSLAMLPEARTTGNFSVRGLWQCHSASEKVFECDVDAFFTRVWILKNEVFMWHMFDVGYVSDSDRVRGCVLQYICNFRNIQKKSASNTEVSTIPYPTLRHIPLTTPKKRVVRMCACATESTKRNKKKREGKGKRVR